MEVAAPPACSASPPAAIASWSATTYLAKPYRIFHNLPSVDALGLGGREPLGLGKQQTDDSGRH